MIPEFAIREWNETVPWTDSEQVEQDLLICRALTEIYKDEYLASHLAFRGEQRDAFLVLGIGYLYFAGSIRS